MSGHQRKPVPQSRQQAGNLAPKLLPYRPQPSGPPRKPPTRRESPRIPSKSISKGTLIALGLPVYAVAAYSAYLYQSYKRAIVESQNLDVPLDVSDRYDKIAKNFDNDVGFGESIIGLGFLRKWMAGMARGHVLEVSAGTGRNLQYYPLEKCKSITLVDGSKEMLDEARKKFNEFHPDYANVSFLVQDATVPISPPPNAEFDTIIQTMGLCSTPRPVELLKNIGSICNKDGQILLLEHGRSHYQWINKMLDNLAPAHANRFGCWWNRDIGKIVDESGLEVVKVTRYHLGTTWWVELRPVKEQ